MNSAAKRRFSRRRWALALLLMFVAPLALATAYLVLTRSWDFPIGYDGDHFALAVAIVSGLAGISLLPIRRRWRLLLAAAYIPVAGAGLTLWSLLFVCGAYGDCL